MPTAGRNQERRGPAVTRRHVGILAALVALAAGAAALGWFGFSSRGAIDPDDPDQVALGREIYATHCASCHGANLEGQPDWRSRRPDGRLPAPPHDASGHTWHHPDAVLFQITRQGPAAIVGGSYASDMPGFGGVLPDVEIHAVLAFIKSTWPEREQELQERQSRLERNKAAR